MIDRQPTRPGRVKITPEDGSPAFYGTVEMADEPAKLGTPLNKENFLKDATAELFGLTSEAVPDDVLKEVGKFINIIKTSKKSEVVSYVGTGTSGASSPSSVTFKRPISAAIWLGSTYPGHGYSAPVIDGENRCPFVPMSVLTMEYTVGRPPSGGAMTQAYAKKSNDGKSVTWYSPISVDAQLNNSRQTYYVLGIYE